MNYVDMEPEELTAVLWEKCNEVAEIAHAMSKCLIVVANGNGNQPIFSVIDAGETEEVLRG